MKELSEMLLSIKSKPAKFAVDGTIKKSPLPCLNVKGLGPICLPLCADQAKKIIDFAKNNNDENTR